MKDSELNRRQLLTNILLCTLNAAGVSSVNAANEKLDPADPVAKNLGYVDNALKVDVKKYPTYAKGQTCANCSLIQLRYGPMRPCSLFPGKMVTARGWCNAWVPRAFSK